VNGRAACACCCSKPCQAKIHSGKAQIAYGTHRVFHVVCPGLYEHDKHDVADTDWVSWSSRPCGSHLLDARRPGLGLRLAQHADAGDAPAAPSTGTNSALHFERMSHVVPFACAPLS